MMPMRSADTTNIEKLFLAVSCRSLPHGQRSLTSLIAHWHYLHSEQLSTTFPPSLVQSDSVVSFLQKPFMQQHFLSDDLSIISDHPLADCSIAYN